MGARRQKKKATRVKEPVSLLQLPHHALALILTHLSDKEVHQVRKVNCFCRDLVDQTRHLSYWQKAAVETMKMAVKKSRDPLATLIAHADVAKRTEECITIDATRVTTAMMEEHDAALAKHGVTYSLAGDVTRLHFENVAQVVSISLSLSHVKRAVLHFPFDALPHRLHTLRLNGCHLKNMPNLTHLEHLQHLDLNDNQLRRVDGRRFPVSLKTLHLSMNRLERFDRLYKLVALEELDVSGNDLFSPIHHDFYALQKLRRIDISMTFVDQPDFTFEDDILVETNHFDLGQLRLPPSVEAIIAEECPWIVGLGDHMRTLPVLRCLEMPDCVLYDDLDGAWLPSSLKRLICPFVDGSILVESLSQLEFLEMQGSISPNGMTFPLSLRRLEVKTRRLPPLTLLHGLDNLTHLLLWECEHVELSDVVLPPKLTSLIVQHCNLASIRHVAFPDTLRELDVSDNQLTEVPNTLPKHLAILDLACNQIRSIPFAALPPYLTTIDVSENLLTSLKGVEHLRSLWQLLAASNKITVLDVVFPPTLYRLVLSDNPFTSVRKACVPSTLQMLNVSEPAAKVFRRMGFKVMP